MDIAKLNPSTRVAYGKKIEERIRQALRDIGKLNVEDPDNHSDVFMKIDGWLVSREVYLNNHIKEPIQIKYRESGDDILYEIFKDWESAPCKIGRDFGGKATYYVVLNRAKTEIVISDVDIIKTRVRDALKVIGKQNLFNKRGIVYKNDLLEIRTTIDPHDKIVKLMGFIPFNSIRAIKRFVVDPQYFIV